MITVPWLGHQNPVHKREANIKLEEALRETSYLLRPSKNENRQWFSGRYLLWLLWTKLLLWPHSVTINILMWMFKKYMELQSMAVKNKLILNICKSLKTGTKFDSLIHWFTSWLCVLKTGLTNIELKDFKANAQILSQNFCIGILHVSLQIKCFDSHQISIP